MKKNHIRLLVAVMLVALLGLLGIQWSWVKNAVNLKENQFERDVYDAMLMVSERLQDRETAMLFANTAPLAVMNSMANFAPPAQQNTKASSKSGGESLEGQDLIHETNQQPTFRPEKYNQRFRTITKFVNGEKVEQMDEVSLDRDASRTANDQMIVSEMEASLAYLENVFDRVFNGRRPIAERINAALLDSLIRRELRNRNIEEPFIRHINHHGPLEGLLIGNRGESPMDSSLPIYRVLLFPHDISPGHHFLELQFPNHSNSTVRAMGLLLPTSGVLVLVVVFCFGIAVFAWQRQQKLSILKTDFINNMTHELKTPISTISLALEALGDPDMQSSASIGTYTKMIRQENERLKSQVERVLQAAAFERGELKLTLEESNFAALVASEIDRIRIHVERRGGVIEFENLATNTRVSADEMHLAGLVFNLLDNANKYSPEAPQIKVQLRNTKTGIALSVRDEGIGMSRDAQKRIFEKFYRVPTGNIHDVKGFGLGLSYVQTIANAHNGSIEVNSEVGIGTEFVLELPSIAKKS